MRCPPQARVLAAAVLAVPASHVEAIDAPAPAPNAVFSSAAPVSREPLAARRVGWHRGRIVELSPWCSLPAGQADAPSTYAFDAYDSANGLPGGAPAGDPLLLQTGNVALAHSDMTLAASFAGTKARLVDLVFMVGDPSSPGLNTDFYYTLFTSDDAFDLSCQTPTNGYEGVQLHFGPGDGLFVTNVDLTTTPELFWQLPVDAQGAYLILLSQDADGLQAAYGQPAWWCTGEDELPPEPRAGTNNAGQGVDNASPPGCIPGGNLLLEYPCECNDFTNFGLPSCSNLTASVGFGVVDTAKCPGDCDADGSLSIDDFICFQTHFAMSHPSADCDGDGIFAIDDFICFQTHYAMGC